MNLMSKRGAMLRHRFALFVRHLIRIDGLAAFIDRDDHRTLGTLDDFQPVLARLVLYLLHTGGQRLLRRFAFRLHPVLKCIATECSLQRFAQGQDQALHCVTKRPPLAGWHPGRNRLR